MMIGAVPHEAVEARLYRIVGEDLIGCEHVGFRDGWKGVDLVLRRAAISGRVELEGKVEDHMIDLFDAKENLIATFALDRCSYRALKTKWMRCKVSRNN